MQSQEFVTIFVKFICTQLNQSDLISLKILIVNKIFNDLIILIKISKILSSRTYIIRHLIVFEIKVRIQIELKISNMSILSSGLTIENVVFSINLQPNKYLPRYKKAILKCFWSKQTYYYFHEM